MDLLFLLPANGMIPVAAQSDSSGITVAALGVRRARERFGSHEPSAMGVILSGVAAITFAKAAGMAKIGQA
jgi:hypothetical protein